MSNTAARKRFFLKNPFILAFSHRDKGLSISI
jgi:hypothetical protein